MWLTLQVCNKTVHLVTPAVLKKLNMSSSNSKQKIVYHCLFRDPWFYFVAMLFHYLYAKMRLGLIQDLLGFHFLPSIAEEIVVIVVLGLKFSLLLTRLPNFSAIFTLWWDPRASKKTCALIGYQRVQNVFPFDSLVDSPKKDKKKCL